MSKCENCIYYERCDHYHLATDTGKYAYQNIDLEERDDVEEICDHYKDKSLFVELPCRCKDCKYLRKNFVGTYYCDNEKNGAAKRNTDLNEYCSYAEPKEMG